MLICVEEVVEQASEEEKEEAIATAEEKAVEDIIQSAGERDATDRNDVMAQIEQEQLEKNQVVEDALLKEMKRNHEQMLKERERQRRVLPLRRAFCGRHQGRRGVQHYERRRR